MDRRPATCLRLQLLGTPRWITEHDDGELPTLDALLAARVATLGRPDTAQEARLLWSEHAGEPMSRLDVRLNRLRERLGHGVFHKTKEAIELMAGVEADILGPPESWPRGNDPRDVLFLAGVDAPAGLARWLAEQREHWARALSAAALLRRLEELEASGANDAALDLARQAIDKAPWLANAWLAKARLQYLMLDIEGAGLSLARALTQGPLRGLAQVVADDLRRTLDGRRAALPRKAPMPVGLMRPPLLIGRDAAWAAMDRAWAARRPFIVVGEEGLGKSRLVEEFLHDHGGGLLVQSDPRSERAPYATLGVLLGRVVERLGLTLDEVPDALAGILGPRSDRRPESPVDEVAVRQAAQDLLKQAAADVKAVVIDRLDRADLASLQMLRALAEGGLRDLIHFGGAMRPLVPGPRRAWVDAWLAAPEAAVAVVLGPWRPEHIAELLHNLTLPKAAAHAVPRALHERAGGVPQLVLLTLQRLAMSDEIEPPAPAPRPLQADAVAELQPRLRALTASARPLLELLAVMDGHRPLLARALDCSEADVAAMEDELALHGLLFEARIASERVREAVLAGMPTAAVQHWNAVAASMLAPDARVPRARIAGHWEAAERWPEAAAAYHLAGQQAQDLGQLESASELLRLAAACYLRAKDPVGEFDALHEVWPIERQLASHEAARALVERLAALAKTPLQQARVAVARALLEVSAYRPGSGALALSEAALSAAEATGEAELRASAMAVLAAALAQSDRHDEAIDQGQRARRLAVLATRPRRAREISSDLCYVFYEASRMAEAIALSRDLLVDYEAAHDLAGAGAMEGNLAMLLQLSGNPSAAISHGWRALARHRQVERAALGDMAVMHRAGTALALGYEGRFREALNLLTEGGIGVEAVPVIPNVSAKVRIVRAHLLLLLGDAEGAIATLGDVDAAWAMAMQVQHGWGLSRALAMQGRDNTGPLKRIGSLVADAGPTPLAHAPWLEWSRQGDAATVVERLRELHARYLKAGMPGVARSIVLRRIDRLSELRLARDQEEAAALAIDLRAHLHEGLHASTYLPEAWLIIARALRKAGGGEEADACLEQARQWVIEVALPHVPDDRREVFMRRNPINGALFA